MLMSTPIADVWSSDVLRCCGRWKSKNPFRKRRRIFRISCVCYFEGAQLSRTRRVKAASAGYRCAESLI